MSAQPRLIHTGQVLVDLIMRVGALPPPGGDVLADDARFEVGGGFNVMAAARRSGMTVVYAGGHGSGRFGEMVRATLAAEGVTPAAPRVAGHDTGICVALVDATAERTFVTHLGAEARLERGVLDALAVTPRDIVYVSGYSLCVPDKAAVLVDWLEALPRDTRVAFDPGPLVATIEPALLARVMRCTRIWTGNREEALREARCDTAEAALAAIAARLPADALTLVRDGEHGCLLACEGQVTRVDGFAVTAVDSNGAGDAHTGVLLAALAEGTAPAAAAHRANAAAALAVTRFGPATAPSRAEIDALVAGA
ncbi:PfkB family carbohydrate kinase [Burkholderia perseverans]|uniref:PfkB family carbohydrate kinase n=1 Tax=Burkholderia perseverans TaxID=2615214 RepID=UPI001FEE47F9|nr:PfkB family carbohydrate kinase [Burkholderia perseverans]